MYSHLASWSTVKILHVHNSRNSYIIVRIKKSRPQDGSLLLEIAYRCALACELELTCELAVERPPPELLAAWELGREAEDPPYDRLLPPPEEPDARE